MVEKDCIVTNDTPKGIFRGSNFVILTSFAAEESGD